MSFILDALRKSENERQRNTTPGIADAPIRRRTNRRSIWLPLVAVLLGINLSLVAVLWYVGEQKPQSAAPAPVADTSIRNTESQPVVRFDERPVADPTISRELSAALEPEPVAPPSAGQANPQFPTPPSTTSSRNMVDVPTLAELSLDGSLSLPTLHLDIHVYSEMPAERFVFINTAKYREGEKITEGPVVDEINQLGVILTHENRRFLLTRD